LKQVECGFILGSRVGKVQSNSPPIELEALLRAEQMYRHALMNDPGDTAVRLRLAWCLFVQAVHQAGRESILGSKEMQRIWSDGVAPCSGDGYEKNVDQLLRDCMRQSATVRQLTRNEREKSDVELIQSLVGLAGAEQWAVDADEEAARRLYDMTRAMMMETGGMPIGSTLKRIRQTES
jgi:hypothetical protein